MKRRTKPNKSLINQIKAHSNSKEMAEEHINPRELVPTGSTLLNLAMSGTIHGGVKKGTMVNVIGESHGGKTVLALTSFAEANKKRAFKNYKFIYDDVECANSFNMNYLFGSQTAKRVQSARPEKENKQSITVQHFHANILHHSKENIPFIYVLDSFDALDSLEDQKKVEEMAKSLENETDTAGTYGMAKAKGASSLLRNITSSLAKSGSALFIVSQTRDNVNPMSPQKTTRSGGKALKFYAHHEIWMVPTKAIKKKDTVIGNTVKVKITKNKITGKKREVEFDIYSDYGIDDIGSCIDYLIKMKRWGGGGNAKINHGGDFSFDFCTRPKMISLIEESDFHGALQLIVEEVWNDFEDSLKLNRKSKYE